MKITDKKTETITIRITEEIAQMIESCALHDRRKPAELVSLWVEDVAREEIKKINDSEPIVYRR